MVQVHGDEEDECAQVQYRDGFSSAFLYSQAVLVGDTLHLAGQIGWDGTQVVDGIEAQIHQALDNVENVLAQYGANINDHAFKLVSYVTEPDYNPIFEAIKRERYPTWYPAWTALATPFLYLDSMFVELEIIALIPNKDDSSSSDGSSSDSSGGSSSDEPDDPQICVLE